MIKLRCITQATRRSAPTPPTRLLGRQDWAMSAVLVQEREQTIATNWAGILSA